MSTLAALLADIRGSDFESAWIYTLVIFGGTVAVVWAMWYVVRPLRRMWRQQERGLALILAVLAAGTAVMFGSILATLAVNFISIANGPGGTP
jgi:predicted permease